MVLATTPTIEGKKITQYLGLVSGSSIIGTGIMKDLFAKVVDFTGGRASGYEAELKRARSSALSEMKGEATRLGANAVVGISFDFEALGEKGSILMVTVTGTAVVTA